MQRAMLLGMWWAFIVEPRDGLPQCEWKYTLLLHETARGYKLVRAINDPLKQCAVNVPSCLS